MKIEAHNRRLYVDGKAYGVFSDSYRFIIHNKVKRAFSKVLFPSFYKKAILVRDTFAFGYYIYSNIEITLCREDLENIFGKIPKTIYFR